MTGFIPKTETDGQARRWLCWLLAPLVLFIPFAWLSPVSFSGNTDSIFYANVLALVSDTLHAGSIHPGWFTAANAGVGSPVMLFYAPLGYLLTALINWPFAALHLSITVQFLIGIYASQVVSCFTAWLWLKRLFAPRIAFIGSLVFVLLPYKFIYIYAHCNLAQLWALAFLPLWMFAAEDMLKRSSAMGAYALALAAVYYTHPLTVLAFGAVPALYVLWFGRGQGSLRTYIGLLLAHVLAFGLCLMQALPQHYYMQWIHPEDFLNGKLSWRQNLNHIDVLLCSYYGLLAVIGWEIGRSAALKLQMPSRVSLFWVLVLVGFMFMTEPISLFVWETVKPLQYLQFPAARLHAAALVAVTYLFCAWLTAYETVLPLAPMAYRKSAIGFVVLAFTVVILLQIRADYATAKGLDEAYVRDAHDARIIVPPEYKTGWGCITPQEALAEYRHPKEASHEQVTAGKAELIGAYISKVPPSIFLHANVHSQGATFTIDQCYFPLWQAHDESGKAVVLSPSPEHGLLQLTLPKGDHYVQIVLMEPKVERQSQMIALVCLLLCLTFVAAGKRYG